MNYGVMGFLIAKDILHLILPDSKRSLSTHCLTSSLGCIQLIASTYRFFTAVSYLSVRCHTVYSQSETVRAVGKCVWAHYLTVTGKAGRDGRFSLSAAQQQEVWVQYSALQIALQVGSSLQALASVFTTTLSSYIHVFPQAYRQSLKNNPSDTSIAGLSHTRLFLTSFSQVVCFCY